METHLWVYLGSHFQKDLTEEGRLTLNIGSTILRAEEVPRVNTREKELSPSLLLCTLATEAVGVTSCPVLQPFLPTTAGYILTL